MLQIDSQTVAGVPTVYLRGDFDSYSAPQVRSVLESLTAGVSPTVRVHLGGLDFMDSVALGVLVAGLKRAADRNGSLCLVAPTPALARTLRLTGLDRIFPVVAEDRAA